MRAIKPERMKREIGGEMTTLVTLNCPVRPGVMVASINCQNCWAHQGADEGKTGRILCSEDDQTLGAFVRS